MDSNYKERGTVLVVTEETGSTPFTTGNNDSGQLQLLFSGNRRAATLSSDAVYDTCFSEVVHCLQTTEPGNLKTDALRDFLYIIGNLLLIYTLIYNMCSNTIQCMVSVCKHMVSVPRTGTYVHTYLTSE